MAKSQAVATYALPDKDHRHGGRAEKVQEVLPGYQVAAGGVWYMAELLPNFGSSRVDRGGDFDATDDHGFAELLRPSRRQCHDSYEEHGHRD